MDYYPLPDEHLAPPKEYINPPEPMDVPKEEFAGRSGGAEPEGGSRHSIVRKMILMPLVATVAAVSIVMASFGYDPLGLDLLNGGKSPMVSGAAASPGAPSPGTPAPGPSGPSVPTTKSGELKKETEIIVHVTFTPTGESYTPDSRGEQAMKDAAEWVEEKGGDPDAMTPSGATTVIDRTEFSEDAVYTGDPEDPENITVQEGTVTIYYVTDEYYEADAASGGDSGFPKLSNLDPDFAGNEAWSGEGSEEYIRYIAAGDPDYTYIEAGSVWQSFGAKVTSVPNAVYDPDANVLYLTDFTADFLDVNLMGNGFTICLSGDNRINQITIWGAYYGGSLTLTGSGSLTVDMGTKEGGIGIHLKSEWSQTCLMIDRGVTLDVTAEKAILVESTTMEKAIYYLKPVKLTGGVCSGGEFVEYYMPVYDENGYFVGQEQVSLEEISKEQGENFYDYSIVDENGKPSSHVHFAP